MLFPPSVDVNVMSMVLARLFDVISWNQLGFKFPIRHLKTPLYLCFNQQQCFYFVLYFEKLLVPELTYSQETRC